MSLQKSHVFIAILLMLLKMFLYIFRYQILQQNDKVDIYFNQSKLIIENRNQTLIGEKRTLALHSRGLLACLAKSPAWEKVLPHFSQPKGFRPMCDRM